MQHLNSKEVKQHSNRISQRVDLRMWRINPLYRHLHCFIPHLLCNEKNLYVERKSVYFRSSENPFRCLATEKLKTALRIREIVENQYPNKKIEHLPHYS